MAAPQGDRRTLTEVMRLQQNLSSLFDLQYLQIEWNINTFVSTVMSITTKSMWTVLSYLSGLLWLTSAFSIDPHNSASLYDAQKYQQTLSLTQSQFKSKLDEVKAEIKQIEDILQNKTIDQEFKLGKLTQGMADERNSLYDMQQILNLPFDLRACSCTKLDPETKTNLRQKAQEISQQLNSMKQKLRPCEFKSCPRYEEIMIEINQELNYLERIKEVLESQCSKKPYEFQDEQPLGLVDTTRNIYKDNLKADNWFYGSISERNYILKRFELSTKYNLTSCPLDQPYADILENRCFQCEKQDEQPTFFNLGSRSCFACSGNQFFNQKIEECQKCPEHTHFDSESSECVSCPDNTILTGEGRCQKCPPGQHVDPESYSCQSCPEEEYYNSTFTKCMGCDISGGYYLNKSVMECELCPSGLFFSLHQKKCVECPEGFHYDRARRKCLACPNNQFYQQENNTCQSCAEGQFYSTENKKCDSCPAGLTYNQAAAVCTVPGTVIPFDHRCPTTQPYFNKYSTLCSKCPFNQEYNASTYSCKTNNFVSICPHNKPVYNMARFTCEACPADMPHFDPYYRRCDPCSDQNPVYNPDQKICKACPSGQTYEKQSGRCLTASPSRSYTTTTAPAVVDSHMQSQIHVQHLLLRTNLFSHEQECPQKQYFNLTLQQCRNLSQKCSIDQFYDKRLSECRQISQTCSLDQQYNSIEHYCQFKETLCSSEQFYNKSLHMCQSISDSCTDDQFYYSQSKECIDKATLCTADQIYNQTKHQCVSIASTCTVEEYYDFRENKCMRKSLRCTQSEMYNSSLHQCISIKGTCTADQTYTPDNFSCTNKSASCKQDEFYSQDEHKCLKLADKCEQDEFLSTYNKSCIKISSICTNKQFYNPKTHSCESKASRCQKYQYFSDDSLSCQNISTRCTTSQRYDQDQYQCVSISSGCTENQFYEHTSRKCAWLGLKCTAAQYFDNETHACKSGRDLCYVYQYYHKPTNSCIHLKETCKQKQQDYSVELNKCVPKCGQRELLNKKTFQCEPITRPAPAQSIGMPAMPSSQGDCKKGEEFSSVLRSCVKKMYTCLQNQFYNEVSMSCETAIYMTSPFMGNLLSQDRDFDWYSEQYQSEVNKYASQPYRLRQCPYDKPYFDSHTNACIKCSQQSPLWNLETSKCAKCGSDYQYSSSRHRCVLSKQNQASQ